jgi:hypothetical protein
MMNSLKAKIDKIDSNQKDVIESVKVAYNHIKDMTDYLDDLINKKGKKWI